MVQMDLSPFNNNNSHSIFAGAMGGIVRWLSLKETWRGGLTSVIIGAISSLYLTPILEPFFDPIFRGIIVDDTARIGFTGFFIGFTGIGVLGFIIDMWRLKRMKREEDDSDDSHPKS
jgi:hypothetical protein